MSTGGVFAVVAGGGTSGHVLPALAIAEALVDAGHEPSEIHYIGARRGIETRLLLDTPFPHTFLDVVGLQRGFALRQLRANATMLPKLLRAVRQAGAMLRDSGAQVVVSVGGYASLPAVLAARRLKIPVVVVSYDRTPGRASQLTARFAAACAVAFDDSPLPRKVVTGAPVRRVIREVDRVRDRATARAALGVPTDRFLVAVTGGSQGSGVLNDAVAAFVAAHLDDDTLAVRHLVGERFAAVVPGRDDGHGILHQVVGYDDHIEHTYAAADLFVGRGGASTVAEVAVTGVPSILVPWAASAEDHQTRNVAWLADQGGAVALAESAAGSLGATIDRLRVDAAARAGLATAAAKAGERHRTGQLVALVERVAALA